MDKYKLWLSIGYAGAKNTDVVSVEDLGFSQDEWDKLTQSEKDKELRSYHDGWVGNFLDSGWELID